MCFYEPLKHVQSIHKVLALPLVYIDTIWYDRSGGLAIARVWRRGVQLVCTRLDISEDVLYSAPVMVQESNGWTDIE